MRCIGSGRAFMLAAFLHCRVSSWGAAVAFTVRNAACVTDTRRSAGPTHVMSFRSESGPTRLRASASSYADFSPEEQAQHVQDALYRVRQCNIVPDEVRQSLIPFVVDEVALGAVTPKTAEMLCHALEEPEGGDDAAAAVFAIVPNDQQRQSEEHAQSLTLTAAAGSTPESRTSAVARVMGALRDAGVVTGWRDELYPVSTSFYAAPTFLVERAAAPLLGCVEYGVHINGVVATDETRMWMARRSATKSKYPSMLDHIVAGGQPAGVGLLENVVKECGEEAGIPEDVARENVMAVGAISYEYFEPSAGPGGALTRAVMFNYDLTVPEGYKPAAVDGEVEGFFTWPMEKVLRSLAKDYDDPLKPNCYLVVVDFLLRRGWLSPEVDGYLDVLKELRGGTCA